MDELQKRVKELEARVEKLEGLVVSSFKPETTPQQKRSKISVGEYLREKKPKTAVDKALVFAAYYESTSNEELFNTDDILSLWRMAKEPKPSNINDLFQKNVKKGAMAEDAVGKDGKKAWYVTNTGLGLIENGFDKK